MRVLPQQGRQQGGAGTRQAGDEVDAVLHWDLIMIETGLATDPPRHASS
jgi:hypothetical protein